MEPRPIKFRAWNKETSTMIDLQKITPLALAIIPIMAGAGFGVYVPDDPRLIIMQFTGLVDREGREIWEGDILEFNDPEDYERGEIRFMSGAFVYLCEDGTNDYLGDCNTRAMTVIGNIHQNPDLS